MSSANNVVCLTTEVKWRKTLSPKDRGFLSKDKPLRVSRPLRLKKNLKLMGKFLILNYY